MIYEKFRSELSDEQSNFIENYMEIVDHAHFQEEQRAYYQGVNCRFVFHTKRKISTATHYLALAVVILIMNNFILETFVQILHFSVYPAKLMIDKYGAMKSSRGVGGRKNRIKKNYLLLLQAKDYIYFYA